MRVWCGAGWWVEGHALGKLSLKASGILQRRLELALQSLGQVASLTVRVPPPVRQLVRMRQLHEFV